MIPLPGRMYLCNTTSVLKATSGNAVPHELVSRQKPEGMGSSTEFVTVSSFFFFSCGVGKQGGRWAVFMCVVAV